jgi:hypothetical protein
VAQSIDLLKEWVKQTQPNIHADETPWMVKGIKEWLWIFANTDFALFHAAGTRSRSELELILVQAIQVSSVPMTIAFIMVIQSERNRNA